MLGAETRILQLCKSPCKTCNVIPKRVDHWKEENTYMISINIFDEVTVKADNYAYDLINLVVDLGSALHLWPGLPDVSIFYSYH